MSYGLVIWEYHGITNVTSKNNDPSWYILNSFRLINLQTIWDVVRAEKAFDPCLVPWVMWQCGSGNLGLWPHSFTMQSYRLNPQSVLKGRVGNLYILQQTEFETIKSGCIWDLHQAHPSNQAKKKRPRQSETAMEKSWKIIGFGAEIMENHGELPNLNVGH